MRIEGSPVSWRRQRLEQAGHAAPGWSRGSVHAIRSAPE
jgi:hypothetical protein